MSKERSKRAKPKWASSSQRGQPQEAKAAASSKSKTTVKSAPGKAVKKPFEIAAKTDKAPPSAKSSGAKGGKIVNHSEQGDENAEDTEAFSGDEGNFTVFIFPLMNFPINLLTKTRRSENEFQWPNTE